MESAAEPPKAVKSRTPSKPHGLHKAKSLHRAEIPGIKKSKSLQRVSWGLDEHACFHCARPLYISCALQATTSVVSVDSFMEPDDSSQPWDEQYYLNDLDTYKNKFR